MESGGKPVDRTKALMHKEAEKNHLDILRAFQILHEVQKQICTWAHHDFPVPLG